MGKLTPGDIFNRMIFGHNGLPVSEDELRTMSGPPAKFNRIATFVEENENFHRMNLFGLYDISVMYKGDSPDFFNKSNTHNAKVKFRDIKKDHAAWFDYWMSPSMPKIKSKFDMLLILNRIFSWSISTTKFVNFNDYAEKDQVYDRNIQEEYNSLIYLWNKATGDYKALERVLGDLENVKYIQKELQALIDKEE